MDTLEGFVNVGKAVSDPTRLRILAALTERDLCVCELVHLMNIGQPAVSRHLGILKNAGLVENVRDGKWVNYRLLRPARSAYGEAVLQALRDHFERAPDLLRLKEEARKVDRLKI